MNTSELFTLANKLRKELHISQKDAYAKAKMQLMQSSNTSKPSLYEELKTKMMAGAVKFTYRSEAGKEITTIGTLVESRIMARAGGDMTKIPGRRTPKAAGYAVYFDLHHGFYRPLIMENIIKIYQ